MTLTHGADATVLREISARLTATARQTTQVGDSGRAQLVTLQGAWEGDDLERFAHRWARARGDLERCSQMLDALAAELQRQAQEQQDASGQVGGGAGGSAGAQAAPFGGGRLPQGPAPQGPTPQSPPGGSTFDDDVRGTEGQPVDRDLWGLAFYAQGTRHPLHGVPVIGYQQPALPEGYTEVSAAELTELGLDPARFGPNSTPQAYVFRTEDDGYVVAFQGSVEGEDWVTNGRQALGAGDPQYTAAMQLGLDVQAATGGEVTFTGHSLGGGLAAAAGLATGQPAVTFDAAGIHPTTAAEAAAMRADGSTGASVLAEAGAGQMRAYSVSTDGLTGLQQATGLPDAPGTQIVLDTPPSPERDVVVGTSAGIGGLVGGLVGLGDGDLTDWQEDVGEGAAVGAGLGEGVWGHTWDPMTDALAERYPD